MKPPLKLGRARRDTKNGGEFYVVKDAEGAWIGDIRAEHAPEIVVTMNGRTASETGVGTSCTGLNEAVQAGIVQVLPLKPQPETVTTSTGGETQFVRSAERAWTDLLDKIENILGDYRCHETVDEDGYGLPLVDVLTPREADSIAPGKSEIRLLADRLASELQRELAEEKRRHEATDARYMALCANYERQLSARSSGAVALDDPFCWYIVQRDITDEYSTVFSEAENCPGPGWKPLYEAPPSAAPAAGAETGPYCPPVVYDPKRGHLVDSDTGHRVRPKPSAAPAARFAAPPEGAPLDCAMHVLHYYGWQPSDEPMVQWCYKLAHEVWRLHDEKLSAASATAPTGDTERLDWLLNNIDPVELDAVLGEQMIRSVNEARVLIDEKMPPTDRRTDG